MDNNEFDVMHKNDTVILYKHLGAKKHPNRPCICVSIIHVDVQSTLHAYKVLTFGFSLIEVYLIINYTLGNLHKELFNRCD